MINVLISIGTLIVFCSHIGTSKYLYIFVIDPIKDNVELRSRTNPQGFDSLHKDFLHYRDYCEGKYPELHYAEAGIAMSFSELTPAITLRSKSSGSGQNNSLQTQFEIIKPSKLFKKKVVSLFEAPYEKLYDSKPVRFIDIPELIDLLPDMDMFLPFKNIEPDINGTYNIDNWLPMTTHASGTWL